MPDPGKRSRMRLSAIDPSAADEHDVEARFDGVGPPAYGPDMDAVSAMPSPGPSDSAALELFTSGLSTSDLWNLLWPVLAGAVLLAIGAAAAVGYVRSWLTSDWAPHWSRGAVGLALMAGSVPAFLTFAHRVEHEAAERGVPVLTFVVAVVAQLGLLDEEGGSRRRRR